MQLRRAQGASLLIVPISPKFPRAHKRWGRCGPVSGGIKNVRAPCHLVWASAVYTFGKFSHEWTWLRGESKAALWPRWVQIRWKVSPSTPSTLARMWARYTAVPPRPLQHAVARSNQNRFNENPPTRFLTGRAISSPLFSAFSEIMYTTNILPSPRLPSTSLHTLDFSVSTKSTTTILLYQRA